MFCLLLLVPAVFGAAIPPQPQIPSTSPCLQACFEQGSLVNAANDLNNFKSIAVDIENFCQINTAVLKCGRECREEELAELEARTAASSYVCGAKVEEFRLARDCLVDAPDMVDSCMNDCGLPTASLRLDSSPAALVNPTSVMDGIATTCDQHVCSMKCAMASFSKACAGAGELFRDMARNQVERGNIRMAYEVAEENSTMSAIVLEYLAKLPEQCEMLLGVDKFDQVIGNGTESETSTPVLSPVIEEETDETESESPQTDEEAENEEVEGTIEPAVEIEEEPEMEETIVDSEGRPINETAPMIVEGEAMVGETEGEEMTPEMDSNEADDEEEEEVSTVTDTLTEQEMTTPGEPVIVIDDTDKDKDTEQEVETNDVIVAGDAQGVVSSSSTTLVGATLTAVVTWLLL